MNKYKGEEEMHNFQNGLQLLGMDHYQVGPIVPIDPQSQDMRLIGFRCGGCGFRCGGCGFRCGGCGGCFGGGCFGFGFGCFGFGIGFI
ncbi:heterocycloanthracin/sonorensin family bacteriocin [Neobacillus sp. MM2021_6]|nr:heterocycloanthracin/sonorensin family bacteriocin [Neobacillus sp. MM2021_6]